MMTFPKPHSAGHLEAMLNTKITTRYKRCAGGGDPPRHEEEQDGAKELECFLKTLVSCMKTLNIIIWRLGPPPGLPLTQKRFIQ